MVAALRRLVGEDVAVVLAIADAARRGVRGDDVAGTTPLGAEDTRNGGGV